MICGTIFDIRKYSIHDGPGIRTTVFFKGCPLHCAWCHNPESYSFHPDLILRPNRCILCYECLPACPHGAITLLEKPIAIDRQKCQLSGECVRVCTAEALQIVGREMTIAEVMLEIEADRLFYEQSGGGVTFSGGEPLAQPQFLLALLDACKQQGLHTAVDTSGFAPWKVLDRVRPYVDLFLYDLKLMDPNRHLQYTGKTNTTIQANLRKLSEAGNKIVVRIPIIPGVNDDEANLQQAGIFLGSLAIRPQVDLLPYHQSGLAKNDGIGLNNMLAETVPPSSVKMEEIAGSLRQFGLQVSV